MWVKEYHKPSPSHHQFSNGATVAIPKWVVNMALLCPHYITWSWHRWDANDSNDKGEPRPLLLKFAIYSPPDRGQPRAELKRFQMSLLPISLDILSDIFENGLFYILGNCCLSYSTYLFYGLSFDHTCIYIYIHMAISLPTPMICMCKLNIITSLQPHWNDA